MTYSIVWEDSHDDDEALAAISGYSKKMEELAKRRSVYLESKAMDDAALKDSEEPLLFAVDEFSDKRRPGRVVEGTAHGTGAISMTEAIWGSLDERDSLETELAVLVHVRCSSVVLQVGISCQFNAVQGSGLYPAVV